MVKAEDGIRYAQEARGLGDVYKREVCVCVSGRVHYTWVCVWVRESGPMHGRATERWDDPKRERKRREANTQTDKEGEK